MADIVLHMLAYELDAKREELKRALLSPALDVQGKIRLEGMQAGIVYARLLVEEIAQAAETAKERR